MAWHWKPAIARNKTPHHRDALLQIPREKKEKKKDALYLSVFEWTRFFFYVSYWRRDCYFKWSSEPREQLFIGRQVV